MHTFDFMGRRNLWFAISALLLVPGLLAMIYCAFTFGTPVKAGIDFTGDTLVLVTAATRTLEAPAIAHALAAHGHPDATVQLAGPHTALVRTHAIGAAERPALV